MSSFTNCPGGGKETDDFIVMRWLGVNGSSAGQSLTAVRGRLLKLAHGLLTLVLNVQTKTRNEPNSAAATRPCSPDLLT